jgi:hypothetical protein
LKTTVHYSNVPGAYGTVAPKVLEISDEPDPTAEEKKREFARMTGQPVAPQKEGRT